MKKRNEIEKSPYATLSAESVRIKKTENNLSVPKKRANGDLRAKEAGKTWKKPI